MSTTTNISVGIVDDDESICRSLGRLLRASGFESFAYPSAEAFLMDSKHTQFDCLVLDIQLGGISGLELHDLLRVTGQPTPVIFITAYEDPDAREQALNAGCAGYFRKNDSGAEILEVIHRLTN